MSIFKPLLGKRLGLDTREKEDGNFYFCQDDGTIHIDYIDDNGVIQRKAVMPGNHEDILLKTPQTLTTDEAEQIRANLHIGEIPSESIQALFS